MNEEQTIDKQRMNKPKKNYKNRQTLTNKTNKIGTTDKNEQASEEQQKHDR